jgi:broad specificity phosphatase PhoE
MSREYTAIWMPFVASVGLFFASTALAHYTKGWGRRRRRQRVSDDDDDDKGLPVEVDDMEDFREWYHSRRVHDRLSYENIQDYLPGPQHHHHLMEDPVQQASFESTSSLGGENELTIRRGNSNQPLTATVFNDLFDPPPPAPSHPVSQDHRLSEWDLQRQARQNRSNFVALERRDSHASVSPHPNSDYDFHPKNRNWRHFEHFNERDPRRNQQHQPPLNRRTHLPGSLIQQQLHETKEEEQQQQPDRGEKLVRMEDTDQKPFDDDDEDNETTANSMSSSGSESSEEQFVWMKHSHRRRPSSPLQEQGTAWKVPYFLNLFTDPGVDTPAAAESTEGDVTGPSSCVKDTSNLHRSKKPSDKPPTLRRNSMPALSSSDRQEGPPQEIPISFPQALQRLYSRGFSRYSAPEYPQRPTTTTERTVPTTFTRQSSAPPRITTTNQGLHHRQLRAQYNAAIMPEKVILIRHGQSMGNINELLYSTTPDNAMPLTDLGWEQAREAGQILKDKILTSGQTVHFIVSPYVRTVETFHGMVSAWCDPKVFSHIADKEKRIKAWYRRLMEMGLTWNEDSRIREQDFGNYQDPETIRKAKSERHRFGVFYYRFPHGESASDVFDRVSTFLDSLWRSFEMNKSQNYVLVTHGISIRVLLARYFRYTIDQFNILENPRNCEMVVLGHNGEGRLELQGRCALELGPTSTDTTSSSRSRSNQEATAQDEPPTLCVKGYRFHKRLRIVPKNAIRKVKIRISPDD